MATTKTNLPNEKSPQTPFQICVKHNPEIKQKSNIFDFTEFKILRLIKKISNKRLVASLQDALKSYQDGKISISWRAGNPVYISLIGSDNN